MQEISLALLWDLLFTNIKKIAIVTVAVAALAALLTGLFVPDTYASQCTMYVMNISTDAAGNTSGISTTGLAAAQQMISEYVTILRSNSVLEEVSQKLKRNGYDYSVVEIRSALDMQAVNNTAMLQITATTQDPYLSNEICNALMDSAPEKVTTVMLGLGSVSPVDRAQVGKKVGPNVVRIGILSAMVTLLVSYAFFLLLRLADNTIKDERELKERFNINVLGAIPNMRPNEPKQTKKKGGK
ncbi:MAG: hypothetical protein IKU51_06010 [Clostridia bacterium]|nr:hypothetical protein [Clostridia bacterium]